MRKVAFPCNLRLGSDIWYSVLWGISLVLFMVSGLHQTYALTRPAHPYPYDEVGVFAGITLLETLFLRWVLRTPRTRQQIFILSWFASLLGVSASFFLFASNMTVIAFSYGVWSLLVACIIIVMVLLRLITMSWLVIQRRR
jgi:hypothetical protein